MTLSTHRSFFYSFIICDFPRNYREKDNKSSTNVFNYNRGQNLWPNNPNCMPSSPTPPQINVHGMILLKSNIDSGGSGKRTIKSIEEVKRINLIITLIQ